MRDDVSDECNRRHADICKVVNSQLEVCMYFPKTSRKRKNRKSQLVIPELTNRKSQLVVPECLTEEKAVFLTEEEEVNAAILRSLAEANEDENPVEYFMRNGECWK